MEWFGVEEDLSEAIGLLTPHPSPLPFDGRGKGWTVGGRKMVYSLARLKRKLAIKLLVTGLKMKMSRDGILQLTTCLDSLDCARFGVTNLNRIKL